MEALLFQVGGRELWGRWMAPNDPGTGPRADPLSLKSTTFDWHFVDIVVSTFHMRKTMGIVRLIAQILFSST